MEIEHKIPIIPNILITGTPGTGKTTLSRLLSEYV
jgi:broad-specificity NMP kinase